MGNRGFTLIEVMVVIIIMGLLFGFAIPSFTDFNNQLRLDSAYEGVMRSLRLTRQVAVSNRIDCHAVFPATNDAILVYEHRGMISQLNNELSVDLREYDRNGAILFTNPTPDSIIFHPDYTAEVFPLAGPTQITLSGYTRNRTLTIIPVTGLIR